MTSSSEPQAEDSGELPPPVRYALYAALFVILIAVFAIVGAYI